MRVLETLFGRKPREIPAPMREESVAPKTVDIKVRNHLTGQISIFYAVDATLAACLRATGLAEPYVKTAAVDPTAKKWSVGFPPSGDATKVVLICTDAFGGRQYFDGNPDIYLHQPPVYCGGVCPKEVLEQYKAKKQPLIDPEALADKAAQQRNADAARFQREEALTAGYRVNTARQ